MVRESVAILVVGVLLLGVFIRSRHPGYALGVLPITFIPLGHLIIRGVLYVSRQQFFGIRPAVVTAFADLLALAVSCAVIFLFGHRIQSKRNRMLYLLIMLTYTVLMGWVYIFTTISVLFA